jgi:hypothetical protein
LGLPLLAQGDIRPYPVFNRAVNRLGVQTGAAAVASTIVAETRVMRDATLGSLAQVSAALRLPVGTYATCLTESLPAGFLLCDGSSRSRTDEAALFAVLGNSWGDGDGDSHFNRPVFPSRSFPVTTGGTALTIPVSRPVVDAQENPTLMQDPPLLNHEGGFSIDPTGRAHYGRRPPPAERQQLRIDTLPPLLMP